jgi:hypothetical protein
MDPRAKVGAVSAAALVIGAVAGTSLGSYLAGPAERPEARQPRPASSGAAEPRKAPPADEIQPASISTPSP